MSTFLLSAHNSIIKEFKIHGYWQMISLPENANVLNVIVKDSIPVMIVLLNPYNKFEERIFILLKSNQVLEKGYYAYIGTYYDSENNALHLMEVMNGFHNGIKEHELERIINGNYLKT